METRALAIAFFYAVGTAAGGITGPLLFGKLVESEEAGQVFWGYMLGAVLMIAAGVVQAFLGIEAARKDLEEIATPLSAEAAEAADEAEPEPAREEPRYARKPTRPRSDRFRHLGPSEAGSSYSPVQQISSRVPDEDVDEEIAALVAALRAAGGDGLDRRALGERVNCRRWGPGRIRHALALARERGAIRQTQRGRFVAEEAVGAERR
jgi:hypothetical protein